MRDFGWMRLAGLFLVLAILAALVRIGGGAEARSLVAQVPDDLVFPERLDAPAPVRWTQDSLSVLEDMRGDPLPQDGRAPGSGGLPSIASDRDRAAGDRRKDPPDQKRARALPAADPPVFYRPADPDPDADSGPVCGDLGGDPEGARIVFPLERRFFYSYEDTWGAARPQGGHEGTDLMTPSRVPEYAITDGTVVPVAGSDARGWNTLGGHALMVRADHSIGPVKRGDLFYYAHLERESPLEIGDRVEAGQVVGHAGDTGQGPPGTSGLFPPHLHLGWYDGTGGREQATSGAMNPYPLLEWIKSNGGAVTGGSDVRFCEAPRTGPPTPSAHGGAWPSPPDPNTTPDLATGQRRPGAKRPDTDPSRPDREEGDRRDGTPRDEGDQTRRPEGDPKRPYRPSPGDDRDPTGRPQSPPEKPGPSEQYDPATGEQAGPPHGLHRPKGGRGEGLEVSGSGGMRHGVRSTHP